MPESGGNPFALVTQAHQETQKTRQNPAMRFESKLRLTRSLYTRGWSREKIIGLFHFVDWNVRLPDNLEDRLWLEINKIEEEGKMPYISSVERIGYRRGWDDGKNVGHSQGILTGRLEAIELGLVLRFGDSGVSLMPSIRNIDDPDRLQMIKDAIRVAGSLEDIRQLIVGKQGRS
jgi:hypothetical protein